MSDLKTCTKCGVEKGLSEFYNRKASKDGLSVLCKVCAKKKAKEYISRNKEKISIRGKNYYKKNSKKVKEAAKDRYRKNPGKAKEYQKEYNKINSEKRIEKNRKYYAGYYEKNKEELLSRSKKKVGELRHYYVVAQLKQRTSIKIIPNELIELKRVQLQIKRHLKVNK